jgi:sugar phosphate isomerase/epimerase
MGKIPVALQLYTVRDEMARDFKGTVRKVAQLGYAGVEFAGTGDLSAAEINDLLAETGLKPVGSHVAIAALESDLDKQIAYNKAIGNPFIGVPFLGQEYRGPQGFRRAAAAMNRIGAVVRDAGMTLYYHNHAFEFDVVEGERGWDILIGETDPALVTFEIDVYWVRYAGQDPAALIQANAGRYPLIHLKDMIGEGEGRTWAEVGQGLLDFSPIFAASEAQGARWYIVEQDRCAGPSLESARISLQNLIQWGKA